MGALTPENLAEEILATGFACTRCGKCCRRSGSDSGLVMVSCGEIRAIMAATGLSWDAVAAPYPESICTGSGGRYTLGWCLRQDGDACRFLRRGECSIYPARPWICRTYPFMIDRDRLAVSECEGTGGPIGPREARQVAHDLVRRLEVEDGETQQVRAVLREAAVPAGIFVVIDSEGMKVIDG